MQIAYPYLTTESLAEIARAALPVRLAMAAAWAGKGRAVFTTSFGLEDQAITHAIAASALPIELVTIDTGRLFAETYDVWAETEARYSLRIRAVTPDQDRLETFVRDRGINGFRLCVQNRLECCAIRKGEPLSRALAGASVWITGLRAEQSLHRRFTPLAEFDEQHKLLKMNPLADQNARDVARFIADNRIPYNVLHDRGFPSIGCTPCTRAVRVGESDRAGRWWWETDEKKECGLHLRPLPATGVQPAFQEEAA
jgi:phosphoadenosine phosphosulfate reductase